MAVLKLLGRIAAVTGGGRGLGRALVRALAADGADVAFSYRESTQGAQETLEAVRALGRRAFTRRADARVKGEIGAFVREAVTELGGLDILINNVGAFAPGRLADLTEDALDEAFAVNAKAAILAAQAAAPAMRLRGGGVIVNVASLGGLRPWPAYLPYSVSKAALLMATRCLARELAPEIRVNAVAPGILEEPGADEALRKKVPLGRFGPLADVVDSVMFLLTGARYTTGDVLRVDGGRHLA